jgi:hypothetical protein
MNLCYNYQSILTFVCWCSFLRMIGHRFLFF